MPGLRQELWALERSAYLDNPLPSLFKERLFVHLSRLCRARYCIVRHVGFLVGLGWPAGDPQAGAASISDVIAFLERPLPDAAALALSLRRLHAGGRTEVVEQIGVGPADFGGDGFQRDRLWALLDQQAASRLKRGGPAFPGVEAFATY